MIIIALHILNVNYFLSVLTDFFIFIPLLISDLDIV